MAKEIKIMSISLTNWRGQTKTVELNGADAVISGQNHSGKSSVLNAFLWCVLGVDAEDRSNYLLFDNTVEQTHDNAVPAEVELKLIVENEPLSLKRIATQGWVRRRGSDSYERSGSDNYSFYYDGIERSAKQFEQDIEDIFGAPKDKLKIMLNLAYFLSLDWKIQRKHLGDIIGEVRQSDFNGDYGFIFEELRKFTIEELKEKYKSMLKPMKESLTRIPIEIETLESNMPSLDGVAEAKERKAQIEKEISDIDRQIADKSEAVREIMNRRIEETKEIGRLEEALEQAKREHNHANANDTRILDLYAEKDKISWDNNNIARQRAQDTLELQRLLSDLSSLNQSSASHEKERTRLKALVEEIKSREFNGDHCAYCGQPLPEDKVEQARQKFLEANDAERLSVVSKGKKNNEEWERVKAKIRETEAKITELQSKTYEPKDPSEIESKIAEIRASQIKYEETIAYKEKVAEIERKRANMTVVPDNSNPELDAKKSELRSENEGLLKIIYSEDVRKQNLRSIEDKKAVLKDTAIRVAELEGYINKIAEYEKEKAEIIRQRVNKFFSYCQVQMETTDKSGNTVPTCIINDAGGVDSKVTNTASQFSCKIDIASAFQKFYDVRLPMFVDNTEAVNEGNLPHSWGQFIELRVSEEPFNVKLNFKQTMA